MSTRIHATVDVLGNPTGFYLMPGQHHGLDGADVFLSEIQSDTVIADNGYDAAERVIAFLEARGKKTVIPSRGTVMEPREYDRHLYGTRYLIANFFARLKQYGAIATRCDKRAGNFLGAIHLAAIVCWLI